MENSESNTINFTDNIVLVALYRTLKKISIKNSSDAKKLNASTLEEEKAKIKEELQLTSDLYRRLLPTYKEFKKNPSEDFKNRIIKKYGKLLYPELINAYNEAIKLGHPATKEEEAKKGEARKEEEKKPDESTPLPTSPKKEEVEGETPSVVSEKKPVEDSTEVSKKSEKKSLKQMVKGVKYRVTNITKGLASGAKMLLGGGLGTLCGYMAIDGIGITIAQLSAGTAIAAILGTTIYGGITILAAIGCIKGLQIAIKNFKKFKEDFKAKKAERAEKAAEKSKSISM